MTLCRVRGVVERLQQQIDVGVEREVGRETARTFTQPRMRLWISQARHNRRRQTLHGWRISRREVPVTARTSAIRRCRQRRMPRRADDDAPPRDPPAPAAPARDLAARSDQSFANNASIALRPTHPVNSTCRRASRQISEAKAAPTTRAAVRRRQTSGAAADLALDRRRAATGASSRPPFSSSMRPTKSRRHGRLSSTGVAGAA